MSAPTAFENFMKEVEASFVQFMAHTVPMPSQSPDVVASSSSGSMPWGSLQSPDAVAQPGSMPSQSPDAVASLHGRALDAAAAALNIPTHTYVASPQTPSVTPVGIDVASPQTPSVTPVGIYVADGHADEPAIDIAMTFFAGAMPPQETWLPVAGNNYTPDDIAVLRAESKVSHAMGIPWQERGPVEMLRQQAFQRDDPEYVIQARSLPSTWRGQPLRKNTLKYAKRGGKKVKARQNKAMTLGSYNPLWKGGDDRHDHDRPGSGSSSVYA